MNGNGFMYSVNDMGDNTVKKIPRAPNHTSAKKEQNSLDLHTDYLGEIIMPDTEIIQPRSGNFNIHQELIKGAPLDLLNATSEQVQELLKAGSNMQNDNNVLFDVFGMQGMIRLFNYYFAGTQFKKISDIFLPVNAKYLKMMHNLPEGVLPEMNEMDGNPFVAHNILEDDEGKLHFIDTDYRPLDSLHPLNLVGSWITKKALKDLESKK